MAAQLLVEQGHRVTLHARSPARAEDAHRALPQAEAVVIGDLSTIEAMRAVAGQANARGRYDAVIHNAGVGPRQLHRVQTADGLSQLFAVNVLAPYVLTALMQTPERLVYLGSGLHRRGGAVLVDLQWSTRGWDGMQAYSDSKLLAVVLAFALARRWPAVRSNALEPGWVATRMGGPEAPDDLSLGAVTQAWLAAGDDPQAAVTGQYFFHQKPRWVHPATQDPRLQEGLLDYCAGLTGVPLP
jgi:NAD(P)-dependent dehydrogenase (short-subunit alcohol dehydrogenase family)